MDLTAFAPLAERYRVLNLRVSQNGRLIASRDWDIDCRRNIYSASKSFTAIAVGIAQAEGLLSIREPLTDAFPLDLPDHISDNLRRATIRDLLTMCLGQSSAALMAAQRPRIQETDWVKLSLSLPFSCPPDTRFVYSNVGPYLAGVLVQRRAGCDLVSYLMPRLFAPLGISRPTWECDPQGLTFGAGGLMLCADELHRFAQLCLQDGNWHNRQLVPAEWIRQCLSRQCENDSHHGYGYLFWGGPNDVFRADGMYGQFAFIDRRRNAAVTLLCECRETPALQAALQEHIFSQL